MQLTAGDKTTKELCVAASDMGQELRDEQRLLAAREKFLLCAQENCPTLVRQACIGWINDLQPRIPSIALRALTESGADYYNVRVNMDNRPFLSQLNGKQNELDPGQHQLLFEAYGFEPVQLSILVQESEQNRLVEVKLRKANSGLKVTKAANTTNTMKSQVSERQFPIAAAAVGCLGAVGIGTFAILGYQAKQEINSLRRDCAPHCSSEEVNSAQRKAIIANVSLGIGVAAAAAATWMWFREPSSNLTAAIVPINSGGVSVSVNQQF
jgi:hypothetical protein